MVSPSDPHSEMLPLAQSSLAEAHSYLAAARAEWRAIGAGNVWISPAGRRFLSKLDLLDEKASEVEMIVSLWNGDISFARDGQTGCTP